MGPPRARADAAQVVVSRRPRRVVLDTHVALSALLFARSRLAPLRNAWHLQQFEPPISRATAAELLRVLAYPKFRLSPAKQAELLADYLPFCTTVTVARALAGVPPFCDPLDLPFLQLTVAAQADFLVTGDRDLLDGAKALPGRIITPQRFLALLED